MKVTHFKKVSETSGVCVLLRLYLFIIPVGGINLS